MAVRGAQWEDVENNKKGTPWVLRVRKHILSYHVRPVAKMMDLDPYILKYP